MSRYKYTKLLKLGPVDGFMIHTPDDRKLKDTHPQTIVRELNRLNDRIKRLEDACGEMVSEEDTYIRLQTWLKAKEDKP